MSRGVVKTFEFDVHNPGKSPLDCTASIAGMRFIGNVATPAADAVRSLAGWVVLEPATFRLGPNEGITLTARLKVPKDAAGGYYGLLSVTGRPPAPAAESGVSTAAINMSFEAQAALLMVVAGTGAKPDLRVADPELSTSRSGDLSARVGVTNQGTCHVRIRVAADIENESGERIETLQLTAGAGYVLPEQHRVFSVERPVALPDGIYNIALRIVPVGGQATRRVAAVPFTVRDGQAQAQAITDEIRRSLRGAGFALSPSGVNVVAKPGASRLEAVEVVNTGDMPVTVRPRVCEWLRGADGRDRLDDTPPVHQRSARGFITLRAGDIEVPAQGRRRVPVTFRVPPDASGEYYAAVVFDRVDQPQPDDAASRARRSVLVRLSPQGSAPAYAMEVGALELRRLPSGAYCFTATLHNGSTCGATVSCSFSLLATVAGKQVSILDAENTRATFVQAGMDCEMTTESFDGVPAGSYAVAVEARMVGGPSARAERPATVEPPPGSAGK